MSDAKRAGGQPTPVRVFQARTVSPREGYERWAPTYGEIVTAVWQLDEEAVRALGPAVGGRRLLDAGCGPVIRLSHDTANRELAVGIDFVPAMLRQARWRSGFAGPLAAADILALPFRASSFDLIWCRLVLGHVEDLDGAYRALSAVAEPLATLVVTDMHPLPLRNGHERSFRDAAGRLWSVQSHPYTAADHAEAASRHGWRVECEEELRVGPAVREVYERANVPDRYAAHLGMPLVLGLRFRLARRAVRR